MCRQSAQIKYGKVTLVIILIGEKQKNEHSVFNSKCKTNKRK
jgi:hypothetical protein